jgi:hypothetical protein
MESPDSIINEGREVQDMGEITESRQEPGLGKRNSGDFEQKVDNIASRNSSTYHSARLWSVKTRVFISLGAICSYFVM